MQDSGRSEDGSRNRYETAEICIYMRLYSRVNGRFCSSVPDTAILLRCYGTAKHKREELSITWSKFFYLSYLMFLKSSFWYLAIIVERRHSALQKEGLKRWRRNPGTVIRIEGWTVSKSLKLLDQFKFAYYSESTVNANPYLPLAALYTSAHFKSDGCEPMGVGADFEEDIPKTLW